MPRILVVEDSVTQRLLLKGILDKAGYDVITAKDGEEGLQKVQRLAPSLVVTDIRMPGMNGYEMCWHIKNDPSTSQLPVILLSGLSDIEDIVLGLEALGDSYIIKPFQEEEILRNVSSLLSGLHLGTDDITLPAPGEPQPPLPIAINGETYTVRSSRQQILNFLLSVYESAIRRNTQLQEIQTQLRVINEKLTERTQDLEASETRFRTLVQTAPDIIYRIDSKGYFVFINQSIHKLGYEPDELIGKHFSALIAPKELERVSRSTILPRFAGKSMGDGQSPKLFDEKRTGRRKTMGLEIKLKTKLPNHIPNNTITANLETIGQEYLVFEVNSAGMYQINQTGTHDGTFIGTVGVIRDITERKQAAEALHLAKEEAIVASKAKSEFLSRMSHELRTPLNVILGFGQLLETNIIDPLSHSQQEPVEQILVAGRHLLELINELLDLARIESGKANIDLEIVQPAMVIQTCLTMSTPLAQTQLVSLIFPCEDNPDLPCIRADTLRFKQVLLNLISNAIKYNKKGGWVTVDCEIVKDHMLEISVSDTGAGIPSTQHELLFKPFSRLDADRVGIEGSGIGLTIAKRLVEMMSGKIGFESTEGKGSRFWVHFPIIDQSAMERTKPPEQATTPKPSHSKSQVLQNKAFKPLQPRRVLLYVEDNLSNARLMEEIINHHPSLSLIHATTAEEGIELAKERGPNLVIMDISLPGMDGFEALQQLKTQPETANLPVVALTANASSEEVEKGKQAGFKRYLVKPVQVDALLEAFNELLDG